MDAELATRLTIAVVAFGIGLAAGAGWLAKNREQPVFVRLIDAIGSGFGFYVRLIFFGAFLYALYLLAADVISPNRQATDSHSSPSAMYRPP